MRKRSSLRHAILILHQDIWIDAAQTLLSDVSNVPVFQTVLAGQNLSYSFQTGEFVICTDVAYWEESLVNCLNYRDGASYCKCQRVR